MTKILTLDTATAACSAALTVDGQIWARFEIAPRRHTELLLGMVDALMVEAEITLNQLDAIAFGRGPGSFMGVRLATGIAQGLGFAADVPLIPVSSLQALAQQAYQEKGLERVLAGWDARMQAIYWGCYALQDGLMTAVKDDSLNPLAEIELPKGEWVAVGNAWQAYGCPVADSVVDLYPQASAMLSLAVAKLARGEVVMPELAEPVYLRDKVVS